jgi:hypothetical protein
MSIYRSCTQEQLERAWLNQAKEYLLNNIVKKPGPLETECWIWTGPVNHAGYGWARYCGRVEQAHRFFFRAFIGEIPPDKQINHRCHIKPCVRPEHLYCGTAAENHADSVEAGTAHCLRLPLGSTNGKFTEVQVLQIRKWIAEGQRISHVAGRLSAGETTIANIASGKTYADVGGPLTFPTETRPKSSRFYGVTFNKERGKWRAYLSLDGRTVDLGRFAFEGDAAIAYNFHVAWLGLQRPLNTITEADWHHD